MLRRPNPFDNAKRRLAPLRDWPGLGVALVLLQAGTPTLASATSAERSVTHPDGASLVIRSFELHEDSIVLDVFAPAREDWRRGEDAYLRR